MLTRILPIVVVLSCLACVPQQKTTRSAPQNDTDGDGVPVSVDACPDDQEDLDGDKDGDGCPDCDHDIDWVFCIYQEGDSTNCSGATTADHDGDGLFNTGDQCPELPEDKDGFQDQDGCPDPDNDDDCLSDETDQCPNNPGPAKGGGCPHFTQRR